MVIIGRNLMRGIGTSVGAVVGPADTYSAASENPPRSPNLGKPSRGRIYEVSYRQL